MEDHRDINRETYNLIARNYTAEHSLEWEDQLKEFSALINESGTVLDLGCGPGTEAAWLKTHLPEATIIGVDSAESMIDVATHGYPGIEFVCTDIVGYTPKHKVDAIWARASLHHLDEPTLDFLFKNIKEYLAPGGFLGMINKYGHSEEIEEKKKYGSSIRRYFQYFNEDLVTSLCAKYNLTLVKQYRLTNDHEWLVTYIKA